MTESKTAGFVNMADFDATLYFLDEREIEYLHAEIEREYQQDLRTNIVGTLFDIFEAQDDSTVRSEVIDHLETRDGLHADRRTLSRRRTAAA